MSTTFCRVRRGVHLCMALRWITASGNPLRWPPKGLNLSEVAATCDLLKLVLPLSTAKDTLVAAI